MDDIMGNIIETVKTQAEYDTNYPPLDSSVKTVDQGNTVKKKRIRDQNINQKDILDLTISQDERKAVNFNYLVDNQQLIFEVLNDRRVRCPMCRNIYKNIPHHLRSGKCKTTDFDRFTSEFNQFMLIQFEETRKQKNRDTVAKSRALKKAKNPQQYNLHDSNIKATYMAKLRANDEEKVRKDQARRKAESMSRQRAIDEGKVRRDHAKAQAASISRLRDIDEEKVKQDQANRKKLSRARKKFIDPKGLALSEREAQMKKRKQWNETDRLKEFRETTKYNAIFICNCCHRRLFNENVEIMSSKLKDTLNKECPGLYNKCIGTKVETPINGKNDCYICKTCIVHLKAKRMPPMSVRNNLELDHLNENLMLTELEGALIAKLIPFQKIYQLPKSRWTALRDRVINVPINDEDIVKTVNLLPRTPKEAELIGVSLKRKLEYKSKHKSQLVNPSKIFQMLDLLKNSGNPYYQFYENADSFQERCRMTDPDGYDLIFQVLSYSLTFSVELIT